MNGIRVKIGLVQELSRGEKSSSGARPAISVFFSDFFRNREKAGYVQEAALLLC